MPEIDIKLVGDLTKEQREQIASEVTETIARHTGKDPKYVYVTFTSIDRDKWAIGGKLLG